MTLGTHESGLEHKTSMALNNRNLAEYPELTALKKELQFNNSARSAPNSRSSSFKHKPRPKGLHLRIEEPRRNSLPNADNFLSASYTDISSTPRTEPLQRVRSFRVTSKGLVNRGDSFRRKSSTSIASTGSSARGRSVEGQDEIPRIEKRERIPSDNSELSTNCSSCTTTSFSTENAYRVLVLGDVGVGKSALINQFMTSEYMGNADRRSDDDDDDDVTKGQNDLTVSILLDGEESNLEFIDTDATHEWKDHIDCSSCIDAYLVVYSVDSRLSFNKTLDILQHLRVSMATSKPILVVANKIDLVRHRLVKPEEGKKIAEEYNCKLSDVSVAINHHVDELLVGILRQIRLKIQNEANEITHLSPKRKHSKRHKSIFHLFFRKSLKRNSCENLYDL